MSKDYEGKLVEIKVAWMEVSKKYLRTNLLLSFSFQDCRFVFYLNVQKPSEFQSKYPNEDHTKEEEEGLAEDEHGETLCGACGENYAADADEFWICCDVCEKWFHGKCVKITPARAEHIKQYKCPSCSSNKRSRPS
ncbi:hypothetical protein IEQ34_010765 [Dendrobium chrysotoxum]|uniref:PHD finger protein ALFIN-LIKE n=1 Tax=Dendrobium chrysotoxum TaxID=161865 RepID=A0AAV7GVU5_DENCH|nr:hypothetical protein IEQ34_010765 [Dendrobium chrysotoxum]